MEESEDLLQIKGNQVIHHTDESEDMEELDPFTALMFGKQSNARPNMDIFPERNPIQKSSSYQTKIDLEALMYHVDTLVESVNGLKPLFKKAYPYIQKVWSKK